MVVQLSVLARKAGNDPIAARRVTEGTLHLTAGLTAAAEIVMPETSTDFCSPRHSSFKRLLVLDGVQDPGNLGTLLRTALALGWQGAFLLPGAAAHHLRTSRPADSQRLASLWNDSLFLDINLGLCESAVCTA